MTRSVSRTRKSASKSPARVKKHIMSPKSEPKKKKAEKVKSPSRSRSASRGRKDKRQIGKSPEAGTKKLRGRPPKSQKSSPSPRKLSSPKPTPKKFEVKKTPSAKTPVLQKTPAVKISSLSTSSLRPSRSIERKPYTSTPIEPEIRQRFLRHESSSRSPFKVTPRKPVSTLTRLYNRASGTVRAAGRSLSCASRSACRTVTANQREILVTIALLLLVALITYFIFYTDPSKTRAFIHSIPNRVQAWYHKHIARK